MDCGTNGQWALTPAPVELGSVVCEEEEGCNSCVEKAEGGVQALRVVWGGQSGFLGSILTWQRSSTDVA